MVEAALSTVGCQQHPRPRPALPGAPTAVTTNKRLWRVPGVPLGGRGERTPVESCSTLGVRFPPDGELRSRGPCVTSRGVVAALGTGGSQGSRPRPCQHSGRGVSGFRGCPGHVRGQSAPLPTAARCQYHLLSPQVVRTPKSAPRYCQMSPEDTVMAR